MSFSLVAPAGLEPARCSQPEILKRELRGTPEDFRGVTTVFADPGGPSDGLLLRSAAASDRPSADVESLIIQAISDAARAGRHDVVLALAKELEARRRALATARSTTGR